MKNKQIFIVFLGILFVLSCEDSIIQTEEYDSDNKKIIGRWNWVQSNGGFAGVTETPESEGYTSYFIFKEDRTLEIYKNDTLKYQYIYTLSKEKTIFSIDSLPVIMFGDHVAWLYSFQTEDTLILNDNICDGFSHTYSRN